MGAADSGGKFIPAGRGDDAGKFVSHDGHTQAGPAEQDGPVKFSVHYPAGSFGPIINIINTFSGPTAKINKTYALSLKIVNHRFLQVITGMV
jgi:hypothetical protein